MVMVMVLAMVLFSITVFYSGNFVWVVSHCLSRKCKLADAGNEVFEVDKVIVAFYVIMADLYLTREIPCELETCIAGRAQQKDAFAVGEDIVIHYFVSI